MKLNKKATSIVEAIVIMLIVVIGVTGMYNIYIKSDQLSNSISNKIQAIQIARQGIEAFTNIRDTNWLKFSGDYKNCWNTLNYESSCISAADTSHAIADSKSYLIYRDSENLWNLEEKNTGTFGTLSYIDDFKVGLDDNGIYSQSGSIELKPIFTRELKISYLQENGSAGDETDPKMEVISLVQWVDSSGKNVHRVELEQILTNWKK